MNQVVSPVVTSFFILDPELQYAPSQSRGKGNILQSMMPTCNCPRPCDETLYRAEMTKASLDVAMAPIMQRIEQGNGTLAILHAKAEKARDQAGNAYDEAAIKATSVYQLTKKRIEDHAAVLQVNFKQNGITMLRREERSSNVQVLGEL